MDSGRRILAVVLAVVSFNFLFLSSSHAHTTVGFIWLGIDLFLWWPDLAVRLKNWI